jgi:hypothetical protein
MRARLVVRPPGSRPVPPDDVPAAAVPAARVPAADVWRLTLCTGTDLLTVTQDLDVAPDGGWELRTRVDVAPGAPPRRRQVEARLVVDLDTPGGGRVVVVGAAQVVPRGAASVAQDGRGRFPGLRGALPYLEEGGRVHHAITTSTRRGLLAWSTVHETGPTAVWGAGVLVDEVVDRTADEPSTTRAAPERPGPSR